MLDILLLDISLSSIQEYLESALSYVQQEHSNFRSYAQTHSLRRLLPLFEVVVFEPPIRLLSLALTTTKFFAGEPPAWMYGVYSWLTRTTPYNLAGYARVWLLFYAADFYFTVYAFSRRGHWWPITTAFVLVKCVLVFAPCFVLTVDDRMLLWALALIVGLYEGHLINRVMQGVGRGIDGTFDSIYAAGGPNYHYRRMSGNRKIAMRFGPMLYPAFKVALAVGLWWDIRAGAMHTSSYVPDPEEKSAKSALFHDLTSVSLLTEPDTVVNLRYGVLFLLALSSLSVYSIILAGWSSNSKYAFIGALRSAAQMVSYEVSISLILLPVILMAGSLNFSMITYVQSLTVGFVFPLLPVSGLFLIAMLAETNRTPFDLPEAEAELVAGYNVDYSSLPFAMFFLGEYCNMILISTMYCLLFLAGGLNSVGTSASLVLALKAAVIGVFFVNVRATLPRYRYDQLMDIGGKVFLPLAGGFMVLVFGLLVFFDALPITTELPLDAGNSFASVPPFSFPTSKTPPTFSGLYDV